MDTRTLCLAALSYGPASGYEIKKMLEEPPLSAIQEASFGAIYPALNKLADDGQVVCHAQAQDKRPDKKVYALTDEGYRSLVAALEGDLDMDRFRSDFLLMVMLSHHLDSGCLSRAVENKLAFYDHKLEMLQAHDLSGATVGRRFVNGFGQALYRAAAEFVREHKDELLEQHRKDKDAAE